MKINFKKLREVIRDPKIKPMEKCVLINLLLYANSEGKSFPSQNTLAHDLGTTSRNIRTSLTSLKKKNLLLRWDKRGFSKSNLYIFNAELYFHIENDMRKYSSAQNGSINPIQSGSVIPPKNSKEENNENELIIITKVIKRYQNTFKIRCHGKERITIAGLLKKYELKEIFHAIQYVREFKKYKYMSVNYIATVLHDWHENGKEGVPPMFKPCRLRGCKNGYIDVQNGYLIDCTCRSAYNATYKPEDE